MADEQERGGGADGRMDADAPENWALPAWGAFSESCASDRSGADAWSDAEADVSVETSSVDSTQHQRVYREQRTRRGPGDYDSGLQRTSRDLHDLHLYYMEQRRRAERGREEKEEEDGESHSAAQEKLAGQQAKVSAELKAMRRQLSSFQEKWASANTAKAAASGPVDQQHSFVDASKTERLDDAVQRDAAQQWLILLARKVEAIAQDYAHGPSQSFFATVAYLTGLKGDEHNQQTTIDESSWRPAEPEIVLLQSAGWDGLKAMASPDVSGQIMTLEKAVAQLTESVRGYSKRQLESFDQSIRQLQAFHNDRVQRVVDESLEELKMVRGRYRKREERYEMELRSIEADRKQYEADLLRVRELLESAYAEKEEEIGRRQSDQQSASVSLEQTRAQVSELQGRCKALIAQQESAKELYDLENLTLRQTIGDLRERLDVAQSEHDQEKQRLEETIAALERRRLDELQQYEERVKEETRAKIMQEDFPARVREVERRYADQLQVFKQKHDAQVAELTVRIEEAAASVASSAVPQRTTDVQTEEAAELSPSDRDVDDKRVQDLTRKCRALEKLLDKKFEDASESLSSSSRLCASCHSESGSVRLSAPSRSPSPLRSLDATRPHGIEKSKALARALLSSSRTSLEDALFSDTGGVEDDTVATEEQTTMDAGIMWDSASFSSADSMDDASSLRPLPPRAPSAQAPSTQEMAALARKLKRFAVNAAMSSSSVASSYREPDPELNSDARRAPRRYNAVGGKKSPAARRVPSRDTKAAASDRRPKTATTGFSSFDDLLQSISARRTSPQ